MSRVLGRTIVFVLSLALALHFTAGGAYSRVVKGVEIPETVQVAGKTLKLVGAGVRTKTFLRIKVYIGALYMENPTKNREEIISSDQPKRMVMHFLYKKVGKEKIIEGWNEGFENNAADRLSSLKDRIEKFNSMFDTDLRKGEEIILTYLPGVGTEVVVKGEKKGVVEGKDFAEALFSIWFGKEPADEGLMEEILE